MIPREYLKKIRRIEIRTNKLAQDLLTGVYHSVFRGRGMDFEEVREYLPGDDIRAIDWNVTARTGVTHIKRYREERELTIMILIDVSASGQFGSGEQSKRELAAEIASVLAFSASRNGDKVGLILFSDQIESFLPPRKSRAHVFRLIREILYFKPAHKGTSLKAALDYLNLIFSRRSVVFIVSDFQDANFEKALRITHQRHDVIAVAIHDRRELDLPNVGWITLADAETGEALEINTSDAKVRAQFAQEATQIRNQRCRQMEKLGLDVIKLETGQPYQLVLKNFFERRIRRSGR